MSVPRRPLVELLYVNGCPHWRATLRLIEDVADEVAVEPKILLVNVWNEGEARRRKFLGSPTVRVDGVDVEPRQDDGLDLTLACRLYTTESGLSPTPCEHWLGASLEHAAEQGLEWLDPAPSSPR